MDEENAPHAPTSFRVEQPREVAEIKECMAKAWGIARKLTHNPAPNPVSLHRSHLPQIKTTPYVVAEKTDGVRYVLVLGRFTELRQQYAVLVDRAFTMYQIQVFAPKDFFYGSVFDGEMVWNKEQRCFMFLVFDAVAVKGRSVRKANFLERYRTITDSFLSQSEWGQRNIDQLEEATDAALQFAKTGKIVAIPDNTSPCVFLYTKPCVKLELFGSLARSISSLEHDSDGFIFTPINAPVMRNTHAHMFKWKYHPTIDLELCATDSEIVYRCQDGANAVSLQQAFPNYDFVCSMGAAFTFKKNEKFIIETSVHVTSESLGGKPQITCKFHRFRTDKTTANHCRTIRDILREVVENITLKELINLSSPNQTSLVESSM